MTLTLDPNGRSSVWFVAAPLDQAIARVEEGLSTYPQNGPLTLKTLTPTLTLILTLTLTITLTITLYPNLRP